MIRRYVMLPDIPDAGLLDRYLDTLGVIVPLARTNLVINPSIEAGTSGYTAVGGSIAQVGTVQYHGAKGLNVTPSAGTNSDGVFFGTVSLTSGVIYGYSVKFIGFGDCLGKEYLLQIATTGGTVLHSTPFTASGKWQWIRGLYAETSTTTRRVYIRKNNHAAASAFVIDGLQVESCADGYNTVTTFIDGDQTGLVANQFPVPYGWNGTPQASTSYRTAQTRSGGRIVRLRDLGFFLTTIIGLGMAPPQHQALTFAQLDGGQYQNTIKPPRTFSLAGRVAAATPNAADTTVSQLSRLFDRDMVAQRQPLVLTMQAQACGADCGEPVAIPSLYSGGLEGNVQELPTAQLPITFTQYIPFVTGRDEGSGLNPQQSVTNANRVLRRAPDGTWGALGTGASGGDVYTVTRGNNGLLYIGGDFTSFNGVANTNHIASYDPATGTVAALGTGASSGIVLDLQIAPNGDLYAVGTFANMGGVAAADFVAIWNGSAWSAPGTPPTVSATWPTLATGGAFDNQGRFYLAAATTAVSRWNGSAWSTLATGTVQATAVVRAPDGNMIFGFNGSGTIGGATNAVVEYDVAAGTWAAYGGTNGGIITSLAFDNAGALYIAAGSSVQRTNGIAWSSIITANATYTLTFNPRSNLLYYCGSFTTANGIPVADSFAAWNGTSVVSPDVDLPGTAGVTLLPDVQAFADGSLVVAFGASGTATAAGITPLTNSGTAAIYPTVIIRGPTSGTSRIYQLTNTTTGRTISFNYTINAGEVATLTLDPKNISFVSTFQGNILNTILPGSNLSDFSLQPGANTISFFAASSTVAATLQWQIGYNNLNDALYQAAAP